MVQVNNSFLESYSGIHTCCYSRSNPVLIYLQFTTSNSGTTEQHGSYVPQNNVIACHNVNRKHWTSFFGFCHITSVVNQIRQLQMVDFTIYLTLHTAFDSHWWLYKVQWQRQKELTQQNVTDEWWTVWAMMLCNYGIQNNYEILKWYRALHRLSGVDGLLVIQDTLTF